MLQDYRNYIINIRNSLIQCGVDIPVSPISDYRELFYESDRLRQILWFYRVMAVSGSPVALDGFVLNLKGYYKEQMRQRFYSEFSDYYDSYKNISSLALRAGESGIESISGDEEFSLFDEGSEESVSGTIIDDIVIGVEEQDSTDEEVKDFYSDIDKVLGNGYTPVENSVSLIHNNEDVVIHGYVLDDSDDECIHGTVLDSEELEDSVDSVELEDSEKSGSEHGTLLDDLLGSSEESEHGVVLDDIVGETLDEEVYDDIHYSDEESYGYSDEEDVYDDIHYSDDEEGYSDDEEVYDDIHYSDDGEEEYSDEDDVYDDIHYSDDEDEGVYDDIHYSDDEEDDGVYDDIHYSDDEEVYDDTHYSNEDDVDYIKPKETVKSPTVAVNTSNAEVDLSDVISDKVNGLLTKGKRFFVSESRKLRNGDKY